jgi:hypothetical protein
MSNRCICCNTILSFNSKKKKPVTLWSGHLDSKFTDALEAFPNHEYEDLCVGCIRAINGISSVTNKNVNSYDPIENLYEGDFDQDCIDSAFEYTQRVYEGYDD